MASFEVGIGVLGAHGAGAFEGLRDSGWIGRRLALPAEAGWFESRAVVGSGSVMVDTGGCDEGGLVERLSGSSRMNSLPPSTLRDVEDLLETNA